MAFTPGFGVLGVVFAQAAEPADDGFTFGGPQIGMAIGIVLLIAIAGFLALSETALTRMSRIRAGALEDEGRRGAATLHRLVAHPERFLNPVLLLVLACHMASAAMLSLLLEPFGVVGVLLSLFVEIAIVFVLAESWPKTWAVQNHDRAALFVAPVISAIVRFPPLQLIARVLAKLAPGDESAPATSEMELLAMADAAVEGDIIEREERSMIHSIIEFGDTVVREVMVPRPDMITIDATATAGDAVELSIKHGFSRIPVARDSKDDIAGILYAKDLMRAQREGKTSIASSTLCRPARFAPESKRVSELMREMQAQKYHMAIVLDEYGGTAGLVTLEDLIEELVGEIVDEYDVEEAKVERLPNGDLRVDARILIDELNELLGVEWPSEDWDSIGGLMLNLLGHAAAEGEQVTYEGHVLRAERVKARRIGRVRVSRLSDDDDGSDPEG